MLIFLQHSLYVRVVDGLGIIKGDNKMNNLTELELIQKRKTLPRYSSSFKLAALRKLVEEPDRPMAHIAKEMGIDRTTLGYWFHAYKDKMMNFSAETVNPLLNQEELTWVKETLGASKQDKIKYCRRFGIPYQKLLEWTELYKDDRFQKHMKEINDVNTNNKELIDQLIKENKDLKSKNISLEQDAKASKREAKAFQKERDAAYALLDLKKKVEQLLEKNNSGEDPLQK